MDKVANQHIKVLQQTLPGLNIQFDPNRSINLLVKPPGFFGMFNPGKVETLSFDGVLSFRLFFEGKLQEFVFLIDENNNHKECDSRGTPYAWKEAALIASNLTFMQWSYWNISGNETWLVLKPRHHELGLAETMVDTLTALNNVSYSEATWN